MGVTVPIYFCTESQMKIIRWLYLYGLVIMVLVQPSWQIVLKDTSDESR